MSAGNHLEKGEATVLGHPPGLFLLFVVEMWERFSWYGMRAILVLYLYSSQSAANPGRGWEEGEANYLYGVYGGSAYLVPVLGGYLADRFLGTHRSMVVGALLIILGHVVLGLTGLEGLAFSDLGMSVFIGGLALIAIGTGYFKPCVSVMVGQLYEMRDPRRESAFTIFYMGINVGAFVCVFVCGTLGEKVGWHWGFGAAAVGMVAGLVVYLWGRPYYLRQIGLPRYAHPNWSALFLLLSVGMAVVICAVWHFREQLFGWTSQYEMDPGARIGLQVGVALALVGAAVWFCAIQAPGDKGPVATIILFMLFNTFFWVAFEQAGSTLNVFAMDSTDRHILGWEMPATWFQSLNPLFIVALTPLFALLWPGLARRNAEPTQPAKIGIALLFMGGGYVFIVIGAYLNRDGVAVSMFWLSAMYLLHTVGELFISPTGLAYATRTAPAKYVSFLMGIWFVSGFLALYVGGLIARHVKAIETGELSMPWNLGGRADFFMLFVVSSFGAGIVILVLTPLFKKMMNPESM